MEVKGSPQPKPEKPFLAQMDFLTESGKDMRRLRVRFYPTEKADDPRSYIVRDLKGREVELTPEQKEIAEPLVFPKR